MNTETTEVLTHRDIRLRTILYRVETRDDVVALLRNLLSHCYEKQLPFDDCMGEAVTAPILRRSFRPGDVKPGDVVVSAFGGGTAEWRVVKPDGAGLAVDKGDGFDRRYISYADIVYVGPKKDYDRLRKQQQKPREGKK